MNNKVVEEPGDLMNRALALMEEALQLVDAAGAPGDIGAHLSLAVSRLGEEVAQSAAAPAPVAARASA